LLVTLTPCGRFLGAAEPEGFERVTPELFNFCMVELIELVPAGDEVEVDEAGAEGTGVTVAPGNFVTVVDFNWGRGNTLPAIVAPDCCDDLALKATVFWRP